MVCAQKENHKTNRQSEPAPLELIDRLVDLHDIADLFGISLGAAARRRDRGQLPAPLPRAVSGRSDKWKLSAIREFIESGGATAVGRAKNGGRRGRPPLPVIPERTKKKATGGVR
jgi:hypothetical protein